MTRTYVDFLGTVIGCDTLDRRSRHALARAVDDITVPAGRVVPPPDGELVIVASGRTRDLGERGTLAVTRLRLLVFGRRELRALLDIVPGIADHLLGARSIPDRPRTRVVRRCLGQGSAAGRGANLTGTG